MSSIKQNGSYVPINSLSFKDAGAYNEAQRAYKKQSGSYQLFYEKEAQTPVLQLPPGALIVLTPESAYNSIGQVAAVGESVAEWRNLITGNGTPAAVQVGTDDLPVIENHPTEGRQILFTGGSCKLGFGITPELDFPQPATDYSILAVCGGTNGTNNNRTYWWSNNRATGHSAGYSGFDTFGNRYYYYDGISFKSALRTTPTVTSMVVCQRDNTNNLTKCYDNDNLLFSTGATINKTTPPDTNFLLGGHYSSNGTTDNYQLEGSLKYFMVWKRVLTDAEVTSLYNQLVLG